MHITHVFTLTRTHTTMSCDASTITIILASIHLNI